MSGTQRLSANCPPQARRRLSARLTSGPQMGGTQRLSAPSPGARLCLHRGNASVVSAKALAVHSKGRQLPCGQHAFLQMVQIRGGRLANRRPLLPHELTHRVSSILAVSATGGARRRCPCRRGAPADVPSAVQKPLPAKRDGRHLSRWDKPGFLPRTSSRRKGGKRRLSAAQTWRPGIAGPQALPGHRPQPLTSTTPPTSKRLRLLVEGDRFARQPRASAPFST